MTTTAEVNAHAVRYLREQKGWKQKDLALASGVGLSDISRIENGHTKNPSSSTLNALAEALGVPMARIMKGPAMARMYDPLVEKIEALSPRGRETVEQLVEFLSAAERERSFPDN